MGLEDEEMSGDDQTRKRRLPAEAVSSPLSKRAIGTDAVQAGLSGVRSTVKDTNGGRGVRVPLTGRMAAPF